MILATMLGLTFLGQPILSESGPGPVPWIINNPFDGLPNNPTPSGRIGGRVVFPRAPVPSLEENVEEAQIIKIGRPTSHGGLLGLGCVTVGVFDLKFLETLKGEMKADERRFGIGAGPEDILPTIGQDYIFFFKKARDEDLVFKVMPKTKGTVEAIKKAIRTKEKR